ncbi:MAG: LiaI-LiaF-like domain-containing protein [Bacteroidales bacterium]
MRSRGVFWGVVLVAIGLIFVLRNLGVFYFNWYALRQLWPLILVILGIALLPIKGIVRIVLSFVVVIIAMIWLATTPERFNQNDWNWFWHWNDKDHHGYYEDKEEQEWTDQLLYENYDISIENAVLDLDAVAGKYTIDQTSKYLVRFQREGNIGKYHMHADNVGSAVLVKLNMEGHIRGGKDIKNEAQISLNPNPVWDFKVDAGAAKIDFDLSPFKVDRMDVDGGAMSVKIRLGDKFENTDLRINTGAAEVEIEVPENVACDIQTSTILTKKNLQGFNKIGDGFYQSAGYGDMDKKISIRIDAALSSLKVKRY